MEKEKILSTLKEKLGTTSLSDRTLNDYITRNLPAEGAEPDDAYWSKHVDILVSLNGNFSHDVATQVDNFKKSYNPVTPSPQPVENPAPKEDNSLFESVSKALAELREQQTELQEQLKVQARSKANEAMYSAVVGKAKDLRVANEALWEDSVKRVAIEDGMTEDSLLSKAKGVYEENLKRYIGDGTAPYSADSHSASAAESKAIDDFFAQKVAEGKFPSESK